MIFYEYRGNTFGLNEVKRWAYKDKKKYALVRMNISEEDVYLPDNYEGISIVTLNLKSEGKKKYQKVKRLYIPKGITCIEIENNIFPELEEVHVEQGNEKYSSNGKMIFTEGGTHLKYCLVIKGHSIKIPIEVKEIEENAFYGTEYTEIIVTKKEISIADEAFYGSNWLEVHKDMAIIGNVLYAADLNRKCLVVPSEVKRFHPNLWKLRNRTLTKIISNFVPTQNDISAICKYYFCKSFELNSTQKKINLRLLHKWDSLEEVIITEKNRTYKTVDGVIFAKDGKTLLFYPPAKKDTEYAIPQGVKKIAENAFANQRDLKTIRMPDSLIIIGTAAFIKCKQLSEIHFSPNIKDIPDASIFQKGVVFEGCESLKSVILPEKLEYLGSYAFAESGISSIVLNEKLEQIGEYSLMAKELIQIRLPYSLKRVGKGSLMFAEHSEAYEGTAKGMIGAVNAIPPDSKEKAANILWRRCEIKVLHHRNEKSECFIIPESLKKTAANHLEMAWNGEHINYEEYDMCLSFISDSQEKLEFAEKGVLRYMNDEDNPYTDYLKRISYRLGCYLLEQKKESEFLQFLKRGFLSENALSRLLTVSNQQKMTVCSAYIMEVKKKKERTSGSLRL